MPRELPQQNYRVQSTFITPQNPGRELLWETELLFFFPLPSVSPRGQALDFQHPLLGLRLSNTTEPRAGREHSSHFYFNRRQLSCLALTVQILFPESFFPRALPHHQNHPACECTTEILFISLKQTPKKLENLSPKPKKISWIHFPKK